jgi:transcriptional regulator with XRE-family HTH domain
VKIKGSQETVSLTERYPELAAVAEDRRGLAELASALIQLRARTGQKQIELAKAAGVSVTLLSELENARNEGVAWRTLVRLAKGAGAHIDIRFDIDPTKAGTVDVHVDGDYTAEEIYKELATLIDERNEALRPSGFLAA